MPKPSAVSYMESRLLSARCGEALAIVAGDWFARHRRPFAVDAEGDAVGGQHAGEGCAGELAALVGVEDLRLAVRGRRSIVSIPIRRISVLTCRRPSKLPSMRSIAPRWRPFFKSLSPARTGLVLQGQFSDLGVPRLLGSVRL